MLRDAIAGMSWGVLATIALVIFFITFLAIVVWTMLRPRRDMDLQSQIPISDKVVEPRESGGASDPAETKTDE